MTTNGSSKRRGRPPKEAVLIPSPNSEEERGTIELPDVGRDNDEEGLEAMGLLPAPGNANTPQPTQADVLGLIPGPGGQSPLPPLLQGHANILHWGPRGNRTMQMAIAEVDIQSENRALSSSTFPVRGDHMKRAIKQTAYRTLFRQGRLSMKPLEFAGLIVLWIGILVTIFLVTTVAKGH